MAKTVKSDPQSGLEKPLPSVLDAERSVLGAILLDNKALFEVNELLQANDFFLDQHRRVFVQMLTLQATDQPIDLTVLTDELLREGNLEAAGGAPYISALADGMPRVSNVAHYARMIKEAALLRRLIHATANIQQQAFERETSAEVLASLRTTLTELENLRPSRGPVLMKEIVRDSFAEIEQIYTSGRRVTGVPTGYSELDRLTSGLQNGELIVLAARPSMGKSALALNIAENVTFRSQTPLPTLVFSLEMNKLSLLLRLASSISQVDSMKFRTGHLNREDWRRLTEAFGCISQLPLWIDDSATSTMAEIAARAERLKRDNGLKLVVVDYLQLLSGGKRYGNRQEEVSDISRGLKALAKSLQVPVLALSQLKRGQDREDRQPMLSDLRESGAIEQDADVVMFIHRPNWGKMDLLPEERDQAEIHVAKQRNGPTDMIRMVFRSRLTRFEEAAPDAFSNATPMFDEEQN